MSEIASRGSARRGEAQKQTGRTVPEIFGFALFLEAVKIRRRVIAPYTDSSGNPRDWEKTDNGNFRRAPTPDPTGYAPDSNQPQVIISATRHTDGFNWGYDPLHFGAPDDGYASDPNGVARVREFRAMVQALHDNGLRLTMDVVYNHTAAFGQQDKSVLDKIVPGYYHRMNLTGAVQTSSCCADTASEYAMMEKLMRDTLTRWV